MDCETANDLLLDLAYDELDEVRAAALRRHVDACAECREALRRIARGRSLAHQLLLEEPPAVSATLQAAIAARCATPVAAGASGAPTGAAGAAPGADVISLGARRSRVPQWIDRIGELAMRRQVAMAAVFLLMIGVGLIFYQTNPRPTGTQDDRVPDVVPAVEVSGAPAPTGAPPAIPTQALRRGSPTPAQRPTVAMPDRDDHARGNGLPTDPVAQGHAGGSPAAPSAAPAPARAWAQQQAAPPSGPMLRVPELTQSNNASEQGAELQAGNLRQGVRQGVLTADPADTPAAESDGLGLQNSYAASSRHRSAATAGSQGITPEAAPSDAERLAVPTVVPGSAVATAPLPANTSAGTNAAGGTRDARIARLRTALAQAPDDASRARIATELAQLLDDAGRSDEASTVANQAVAPSPAAASPRASDVVADNNSSPARPARAAPHTAMRRAAPAPRPATGGPMRGRPARSDYENHAPMPAGAAAAY